jgi:hypothetical protein
VFEGAAGVVILLLIGARATNADWVKLPGYRRSAEEISMPVFLNGKEMRLNSGLAANRYRNTTFIYEGKPLTFEELKKKSQETDTNLEVSIQGQPVSSQPAAAGSSSPPMRKVPVSVHAYTPDSDTLKKDSLENRFTNLQMHLSSLEKKPDILLIPEYYFNWAADGQEGNGSGGKISPFSPSERDGMVMKLRTLSAGSPKTLLIPGTLIWRDSNDASSAAEIRNSAYVFLDGKELSHDGITRYDKCSMAYERAQFPGYQWAGGGTPRFDFEFKGLRCRLAICQDSGTPLNSEDNNTYENQVDLQLIVASRLGQDAESNTHVGGCCVHADGDGFSVSMKRSSPQQRRGEREQKNVPAATHEVEVEIPDKFQQSS